MTGYDTRYKNSSSKVQNSRESGNQRTDGSYRLLYITFPRRTAKFIDVSGGKSETTVHADATARLGDNVHSH